MKFKSCLYAFKSPHTITLWCMWCTFHGIHMTILWRVLTPLKYQGCIEMFNRCNTEQSFQHFLSMHLITHSQLLFSLHTKRFKAHRLNIKSQNESNVNLSNYVSFIFRLFKFIGSWLNLKSTWMSTLKSATLKGASTF